MTIKFPCPKCGQGNAAEHDWVGREVQCGRCGTAIQVPYPKPQVLDVPTPAAPAAAPTPDAATPLLKFRCGSCGTRNEAERSLAGETVQCGSCGAWLLVPGAPARGGPGPRSRPKPARARRLSDPGDDLDDVDTRRRPAYPTAAPTRAVPGAAPAAGTESLDFPFGWVLFVVALVCVFLGGLGVIFPRAGVALAYLIGFVAGSTFVAGVAWTIASAFKERWAFASVSVGLMLLLFGVAVYLIAGGRLPAPRTGTGAGPPAQAEAKADGAGGEGEGYDSSPTETERPAAASGAAGVAVDLPDPPQEPDLGAADQIEAGRLLDVHHAAVRSWLDECWQRLRRAHTDNRVVTVTLRGIEEPDLLDQIQEHLRASLEAVGATAAVGRAYRDGVRAVAGPVPDLEALAVRIDLGVPFRADINGRDMTLTIEKNAK
ncbi:MAG TPA: hypothetical protein VG406_26020 [Isosphaeraceae bacterium]|jgi:DNA-directed RNA polymerase subunit RPC12/RpoP|nr:hypothetical protein [Isosphaeraceae bacterium]